MKFITLVLREMLARKSQLATSFFAVLLGITVIVAVRNITYYSEKAVSKELDALGANILILPKSTSLQDYYSADMQDEEMPEEYVGRLLLSDLQGLDNMSPKLSIPVELASRIFVLTGILPKNEFQAKASWQGAGIFSRPQGCGIVVNTPDTKAGAIKETLVRKRVVESLADNEALLGKDVAASLKLQEGDAITVLDKSFVVRAVLPQTGTVDDTRIFAHLHTVQRLSGKGSVVNAIEVVGCCDQISKGLVQKINRLLPEAKVVTIAQIVETQIRTNGMMSQLSLVFLIIIILVGGAGIANYMYANVLERRREIGTMMALGAGPLLVLRLFIFKALLLGLAGGVGGYIIGTALAVTLGPRIAHVPVLPMPLLILWALCISIGMALVASYLPARRAARLDPCTTLQEV